VSKALTDAIQALTGVAAAQLDELREANADRREQRWRDPEFAAERAARRAPLHHTTFAQVLQSPALAAPFTKEIPGEFWAQAADGLAEVACPCRAVPQLRLAEPAWCDCGRAFLYTGTAVRVAEFEDDPPVD
jgi:hypothetical protein